MKKQKIKETAREIIRVTEDNKKKLAQLKLDRGFKNLNAVITFLLNQNIKY